MPIEFLRTKIKGYFHLVDGSSGQYFTVEDNDSKYVVLSNPLTDAIGLYRQLWWVIENWELIS